MDGSNLYFTTLSLDELYHLILAPRGNFRAQRDVFRAMGIPLSVKVAQKFTKNLIVSHVDGVLQDFEQCSLGIGLATPLFHAIVYLRIYGKVFSRVVLSNIGLIEPQHERYYPDTMYGRRIHFERYAAMIAPFLLPEITLEIHVYDSDLVEIFTNKFGNSIKHVNINTMGADFTLKCFSLPSSLKSLDFIGTRLNKLDPLWELVGDSLEKVSITAVDHMGWESCIRNLRTYCRKLSSICLEFPLLESDIEEGDVLDLLCSYGDQLLYTNIRGLGTDSCSQIAQECVNLRCDITVDTLSTNNDFSRLPALHNRVETVFFRLQESFHNDWDALSSSMRSCGSITGMCINESMTLLQFNRSIPIPHEFIQAIFPRQMRQLEYFMGPTAFLCRSESLAHIARSTGKLKRLKMNCLFPIAAAAFEAICFENPLLTHVAICESPPVVREDVDEEETVPFVTELVRATKPCKSLKDLQLIFRGRKSPQAVDMNNVDVPLRTRSVSFSVSFRYS